LSFEGVTFDIGGTIRYPWSAQSNVEDVVRIICRNLFDGGLAFDGDRFLEELAVIEERYWEMVAETCQEMTIEEKMSSALGKLGIELPFGDPRLRQAIEKAMGTLDAIWYSDFGPTMEVLSKKELKLGVISNTSWPLPREEVDYLSEFFDVITTSYEHGFRKPHPSIYNATLGKLGVSPDRAIHVGNSTNDIVGARNAGMKSAFVRREEKEIEADFTLLSLVDILQVLDI
jgi:HAD superfamily hydrolase (TIGR01509 family)